MGGAAKFFLPLHHSKMFLPLYLQNVLQPHPLPKIRNPPRAKNLPPATQIVCHSTPKILLPHHFPEVFATSPRQILPPHPKKVPLTPKIFCHATPQIFVTPPQNVIDSQPPSTVPYHSHNFFCYPTSKIFANLPPQIFFCPFAATHLHHNSMSLVQVQHVCVTFLYLNNYA